jgi:hypothetical protein
MVKQQTIVLKISPPKKEALCLISTANTAAQNTRTFKI